MAGPTAKLLAIAATLCLTILLAGCGDAGGTPSNLSYTGSTSPAALNPTNSASLLGDAYSGGNSGLSISNVHAGLADYSAGASRRPRTIVLTEGLISFVRRAAADDTLARPDVAATIANIPRTTLTGNCGGTATIDGSYDDGTRSISLSANLNKYCQDGTTLNGTVGASGLGIADGQQNINPTSLTVTLSGLDAAYSGDAFSAAGTISIAPQAGHAYINDNAIMTIDLLLKDTATAKIYKLKNFKVSLSSTIATVSYEDITLNGRYYDPDQGYIDVSTPTPLRLIYNDQWPSSGSLRASGLNSTATLTAQSNTTYQLDVDTDGNGSTDSTESGLWFNL